MHQNDVGDDVLIFVNYIGGLYSLHYIFLHLEIVILCMKNMLEQLHFDEQDLSAELSI
jgi:hypothetical protein